MQPRALSLAITAAALAVFAAGPALARPYSTPLHRCVSAAEVGDSIRSPRGTRIEVEIDGITGEVLEVSEKPR